MPTDVSQFVKGMGDAGRRAREAAMEGFGKFGAHVVGDAQDLAPVKTGALKASGTWEEPKIEGGEASMLIGFNINYAAAVHENLTAQHTQGQAKFLEDAIKHNADRMSAWVGEYVKKAME